VHQLDIVLHFTNILYTEFYMKIEMRTFQDKSMLLQQLTDAYPQDAEMINDALTTPFHSHVAAEFQKLQETVMALLHTLSREPRQITSWAVRDWCNRRNIDTHPQRCKPRGSTTSRSLRIARDFSLGLQYHLFQTCLRSTAGHHNFSTSYGCSLKPTTSSARRRKRRNWLTGQSVSRIRRLQRISPPLTLCTIGGSSTLPSSASSHKSRDHC